MVKTKFLNGLSCSLAHSYFSTLNYYSKGYMCDWVVNCANDLGVDSIRIDILRKEISPKELMIDPLLKNLDYLKNIIEKTLVNNELSVEFIKEVIFDIKIAENNRIICSSYSVGENGRVYKSTDYIETSYERFVAINPPMRQKIICYIKSSYGRFRYNLLRKFKIGKLQYTRRLDD